MRRRRRREAPSGGLVIWKPIGISSRAAVNQVERALGWRGLGHTGTLDPLAAGILILLGGQARKFQDFLMGARKVYDARIALGYGSLSADTEGPVHCVWPRPELPTREQIAGALAGFHGEIDQVPPRLSAVRVAGQRAYQRARSGEDIDLAPRRVRVWGTELLDWQPPVLHVRVESGPGFYVRAFAEDLGEILGCGGFLASLRRTHAGGSARRRPYPWSGPPERTGAVWKRS